MAYQVTECLSYLKNLFAEPTYKELTITTEAWIKLMAFIHLVGEFEISGFGRVQNIDGTDCITDFDIIRQEVRSTYVESDEKAVVEFMMKTPMEQKNEWILDWHSHVNMGTSPSGTDWKNYEDMLEARLGKQYPCMIVNKEGKVTAHQYMGESKHPEIKMALQSKHLTEEEITTIYQECKTKVEELCTKYIARQSSSTENQKEKIESVYGATWYTNKRNPNESAKTTWVDSRRGSYWNGNGYSNYGGYNDYDYYERYDSSAWRSVPKYNESKDSFADEDELCSECGAKLDPNNEEEMMWGLCSKCLKDYDLSEEDDDEVIDVTETEVVM